MAGRRKLEDLDITRQELNEIGEALKKEEFRKLLNEYVEDVTNPENKKKFQEEVSVFEKERGFDVTFVNPEPGYVIKTSVDNEKKAFVNVCTSEKIKKPSSTTAAREGTYGRNWSVPYSQAPPREDLDNAGNRCVVYDVVFHPEALKLADWNVQFRNMLNDTALDAVEQSFQVKLDRNNLKFPKMKYKGMAFATVIRTKSSDPAPEQDDELKELLSKMNYPYEEPPPPCVTRKVETSTTNDPCVDKSPYTTPKYLLKHRNVVDYQNFTNDRNAKLNATVPKEIVVEIDLPLLNSTSEAVLDVTEKTLALVSEKPAKYKLFLPLPYSVDESSGKAKFDKAKRKLSITLPVKNYTYAPFTDYGREDSGVESDAGPRTPESSSGEDDIMDMDSKKLKCNGTLNYCSFSHIEEITEENGNDTCCKSTVSCSQSSMETSKFDVEVTKCAKDESVIEISLNDNKKTWQSSEVTENVQETESSKDTEVSRTNDRKSAGRPLLQKCRTLSESSGDEMGFSPSKKGILKRVSRSLSESSADDYTWSSSLDMIMQSGSDSYIPEEEGRGMKKTVRFNEIVHQQTYRSNSSIFGQRKKNQRKTRNKKRSQERRASESENSEGEVEKDCKRETKTETKDGEVEQEEEEEEEGSNNNNNDEVPETNDADEVFEIELKLQDEKPSTPKNNSLLGKGKKKKNIKKIIPSPVTPVEKKDTPKIDFKNDLIFDLDM